MKEEWRIITIDNNLFGDKYSVSSFGRVRNNDNGKILPVYEQNSGYLIVHLSPRGNSKNGTKNRLVHRIVAMTFLADSYTEKNNEVNHIDGNKHNNSVENLEWCTRSYNLEHGYRTGLYDEHRKKVSEKHSGRGNPRAKKVICIETKEVFDCIKDGAEAKNVTRQGINKCLKGIMKTTGGYHWMYYDEYLKNKNNEENDINE